jgi:hypothetical protein
MRSPTVAHPRPSVAAFLAAFLVACSSADQGTGPSSPDTDSGAIGDAAGTDGSSQETGAAGHDATTTDATDGGGDAVSEAAADAAGDGAASNACTPFGAPGQCMLVSACAAMADHSSYAGYCSGPSNIECCIDTPDTADNPPLPAGWVLMQQADVTSAMTTWAVMILNDPTTYPMFSTTMMTFGTLLVMARVEWHPPDFQNSVVHRGVTLYERAG